MTRTRRRGGRMPPRMGVRPEGTRPGRLRYGAATNEWIVVHVSQVVPRGGNEWMVVHVRRVVPRGGNEWMVVHVSQVVPRGGNEWMVVHVRRVVPRGGYVRTGGRRGGPCHRRWGEPTRGRFRRRRNVAAG